MVSVANSIHKIDIFIDVGNTEFGLMQLLTFNRNTKILLPESVSVFFGGGNDLCNRDWAISTALSKLLLPYDTAHGCLFNLNSHALFLSSRNSSSSLEMGYGHLLLMTLLTKSISERVPPIRISLLVPRREKLNQ